MKKTIAGLCLAVAIAIGGNALAQEAKPSIVLVHGAFADASSWTGVANILRKDGYTVIAAANPLRGVKSDSAYVGSLVAAQKGFVVLVGHSYGGHVITNAANGQSNVKALVFVSAFAPEQGETVAGLAGKFPGSSLGQALAPPVSLPDGGKDLYIIQDKFYAQFAADVSADQAAIMAVTQRPITEAALNEPSGEASWKHIASWYIYGDMDRNIPPAAMAFMAKRANARQAVVVKGASHVVMVSHSAAVAAVIEAAATAR